MGDFFENFQNYLNINNSTTNDTNDLILLIEQLQQDLKHSLETISFLQNQINNYLDSDTNKLTTKYVELQENNKLLNTENSTLKDELDNIKINSLTKYEELKQKLLEEKLEIEKKYKLEVNCLKDELKELKINHQTKEKELENELQIIQAASSMETTEIEHKYKQQIHEINLKQRELINSNNNLRTELLNLKQQHSYNLLLSDQKINDLQKQLKLKNDQLEACVCLTATNSSKYQQTEQNSQIPSTTRNYQPSTDGCSTSGVTKVQQRQSKYIPLNIIIRESNNEVINNNQSRVVNRHTNHSFSPLRPLCPTSNRNNNPPSVSSLNQQQRKRKLHNPNDYDYLDEFLE